MPRVPGAGRQRLRPLRQAGARGARRLGQSQRRFYLEPTLERVSEAVTPNGHPKRGQAGEPPVLGLLKVRDLKRGFIGRRRKSSLRTLQSRFEILIAKALPALP